ncbi:DMT family transporter [Naasia sp. SYSU D00057]|uniref:DMT family transporter n=1 Tax=Naasia sp. SYSU D00057 TaxID=2817380 RepID=UPI001B3040D4|nr:DMT family transporter [Naasia sp. SYSU D00057]
MDRGDAETNEPKRRAVPRWLQLLVAVALGCLISIQARVSADLAERSDVYSAAWVTVITGTLILLVIVIVSRPARRGFRSVATAVRTRTLPWWALLGGLAGMFFVVTQGTAAGVLGLAMFGMAVVAGQVVGGLVFDWIGIAGGERRSPTLYRVLGSVLAIAAVSWGAVAGDDSTIDLGLIAMAFVAGLGLAAASGATGRVQSASRSVATAGMLNHLVGLLVIVTLLVASAPGDFTRFSLPSEPWLFLGGVIGPIGVAIGAVLVHRLGVLLLGLGTVAGQLIGALILELVVPTAGVQTSALIGIALTLVAVAVTSLDGRRQRSPKSEPATESPRGRPIGAGEAEGASA